MGREAGSPVPDKRLAAVCGLFCPSCTLYIGTHEDSARLSALAKRSGRRVEELVCHGCRSDKRSFFCESLCLMTKCSARKGVEFCVECSDYPCEDLKKFQAQMPHRAELWDSLNRIKENGFEKWFIEMLAHYSCPSCGIINAAYDSKCRKCGAEPSSAYSALHRDELQRYFEKNK